ncbi:MAG: mannose-6-phosphate isomerase [Candidatus Magasanikbacteria bacterium GW2011_GWA2_56_11]|uniref:Mannose-6-phosphate isomerase n=1 Tax=Candidatus Magasanikbacteria bacterium GW2011_GWA2_56_11 TaxID=1619044 RepID=A0A0G2BAN2_9BACT|nr:MAG: mannose-6-phosphate isomerase [Candidatus Magasanikbacteria bacterium GW2011_GWA2_56_11]
MTEYHFTEARPWGGFTNLIERDAYKVKEMVLKPGSRVSYQLHRERAEHWFVVQGLGTVTLDDIERPVRAGETVDIPVGMKHRIYNSGDQNLVFIEVQTGTYFGEDDIVRLSDDYHRETVPLVH